MVLRCCLVVVSVRMCFTVKMHVLDKLHSGMSYVVVLAIN